MNIETLRDDCLSKPGVTESCPFGPDTLVFKVGGKIFLIVKLDHHPLSLNAKCDPDYAVELREQYPGAIDGAYHMNKRHWNEVVCDGRLSERLIRELVEHSYTLVLAGLPKAVRDRIVSL